MLRDALLRALHTLLALLLLHSEVTQFSHITLLAPTRQFPVCCAMLYCSQRILYFTTSTNAPALRFAERQAAHSSAMEP
jgi:hypothetical protein